MSLSRAFASLLRRDLVLTYRRRAEAINPLFFFLLVVTLFPLGVGADARLLQSMGPGVIWVAALLAAMLSLDGIFRSDFDDGTLEQLVLSPHPLSVLVLAKVIAHWLVTGLPLLVMAPLLAVLLGLSAEATWILMITLALGTPVLSLVGAIGVALTVGLRRGGVLLSLLVLPLYVPVLIFASNAVQGATAGLPVDGQLYMLGAFLLLALVLTPLPTAAALRISLS
ncbi:heme exporter protein CcmB [Thiohalobacter sp. IOR34]|uniref:heme exporter protein CcmB n=1 Tax=Thiohalobacter sp. IOR34 TaxID=3057176 RepID=UPI00339D5134